MRRVAVALAATLLGVVAGCGAGPGGGPSSAAPPTPPSIASPGPAGGVASTSSAASTSVPSARSSGSPAPAGASGVTTHSGAISSPSTDATTPAESSGSNQASVGGFTGSIAAIGPATAARMAASWHAGCPVPLADLRYLTLTYRGFDGADQTGELVVAASVAEDVVAIFRQVYADGYPIGSMRLVDDFGGDDNASMSANNTSAFNCRPVTGGGGFSEHSYGTAIDVNPVQNPYLSGTTVLPAAGRQYVDRPDEPGVIHDGDDVVQAFAAHGFSWGGDWTGPIDYQHFSVSGR